jgi:hypothetical protein
MTAKELISRILDLSEIALRNGNHEAYRKCMELIADIARDEVYKA